MSWIVYASLSATFLGLHQLAFKQMSGLFHPVWGFILFVGIATLLTVPLAFNLLMRGEKPMFTLTSLATVLAVAATGVVFALVYQRAFQLSPSTGMVVLIADVGACVITTLIATFVMHEPMSMLRAAGIVVALSGMAMAIRG